MLAALRPWPALSPLLKPEKPGNQDYENGAQVDLYTVVGSGPLPEEECTPISAEVGFKVFISMTKAIIHFLPKSYRYDRGLKLKNIVFYP